MRAALDAAYRYLAYGSRSESEMRIRLRRKGVLPNTMEKAIVRLRELRLLDDAAFAQQWVEHSRYQQPPGTTPRAVGAPPEGHPASGGGGVRPSDG